MQDCVFISASSRHPLRFVPAFPLALTARCHLHLCSMLCPSFYLWQYLGSPQWRTNNTEGDHKHFLGQ